MIARKRKNKFLHWLIEPFIAGKKEERPADITLLIVVALLLFFGLFFLSSASLDLAFYRFDDSYRFVKQQIFRGILPGLLLFYAALRVDYRIYKRARYLFFIAALVSLLLVFFFRADFGTSQSWAAVGPFVFQPSEFSKLFVLIFFAGWFASLGEKIKNIKNVGIFILLISLFGFLLLKQPDMGNLTIVALISFGMFFVAGASWLHFGAIMLALAAAFVAIIKLAPYRLDRVVAWLDPKSDPLGISWQIKQSLIAVGSGGWFGLGLGLSRQKSYIPHPANDSIFAIIAEEIGFVFSAALLFLFFILIHRGFQIAKHSDDNFAKLLAIGISLFFAIHVFINIAGMIQLAPLTGITLPFISLGGTNLVVSLISVGILANISRQCKA
ncbi:MAG: FtsW/RodA/SpoVE family cell cycle protein [Patescibacteria group bacterium]|nr:FtsW/RodA/SpoVE family cell cycle protein [Patescibacteria group bacterium]